MTNSEVYKAHKFIKDFDFEIKRYWDSLQTIDLKTPDELCRKSVIHRVHEVHNAVGSNHQREEKAKLVDETKVRIKQLEDIIVEETKTKAQLVEKNKILETDIERQAEGSSVYLVIELKTEIKNTNDLYEQQKKDSDAKDQILKEYNSCMLYSIHLKHLNSKISDLKTCSLSFDLSDSKQKAFFKEIESAKIRLPDIKRIRIDRITDGDAELNSFLGNCTPDQLQLFCLNNSYISGVGVKADFYIEALCKTLKAVTSEVYIQCLKLTASNLEQIIKASSTSERLMIRFSDISCSAALDFVTKDKYNTKFLSFYNCGNSGRKSDFISVPALFENIVEAMAKSGLKDSLQTLDISGCGLDRTAVQGLLSKHGIGAVSVVETGAEPME